MERLEQDRKLLSDYAIHGDEAAFKAVVQRHAGLVYGTALRVIGESGAAEEISQTVFTSLARKAHWLTGHENLAGWLYTAAIQEARLRLRGDLRRRRREDIAARLPTNMPTDNAAHEEMVELLDEGLQSLNRADREALIARYLEERPLREVGRLLGTSEDNAQKRVARGLNALAGFFRRRGFATASSTAASAALRAAAVTAPPGLGSSLATTALAGAGGAAGPLSVWLARVLGASKTQVAIAGLLACSTPGLFEWNRAVSERKAAAAVYASAGASAAELPALRQQSDVLRRRIAFAREADRATAADLARFAPGAAGFPSPATPSRPLVHRWADDPTYVRVPKPLVSAIQLSTRMQLPAAPPGAVSHIQLPAVSEQGELDPILAESLGLTPPELQQTQLILGEAIRQCREHIAANTHRVDAVPDGFEDGIRRQLAGQRMQGVFVGEFVAEGDAIRREMTGRLENLLGHERSAALLTQFKPEMGTRLNDFGRRARLDLAATVDGDEVSVWRLFRRDGRADPIDTQSTSGPLSIDSLPEPLRPWLAALRAARKGTTDPKASK